MEIRAIGAPARFPAVPVGRFFGAFRDPMIYGFSVHAGDTSRTGALIFVSQRGQRSVPWLAASGLPNDDLAVFANAVIRTDWSSATPGSAMIGAIVSCDGRYYIRAADGMSAVLTFDLETGAYVEGLPAHKPAISYERWEVGHADGDQFVPLFSFPIPDPSA